MKLFFFALLSLLVLQANVSPDFTPVRSELAGAYGFSRGVLNLVVLPGDQSFGRAPLWSLVVVGVSFLVLATIRRRPGADPHGRLLEWLPTVVSGFMLAVALSPHVTPYRVVLAPRTFALCLVLLCLPRLRPVVPALATRWAAVFAGAISAAFFASAMLQTLASYDGNYSGFLHLARDVAANAPQLQERPALAGSLITYDAGYDGQFMYLMAFDPLLQRFKDRPAAYRAFVDSPPYRYGRIGFSAITRLVSMGRPERYPATMMWLIVAAHVVLGTLLASFAVRHDLPPLAALSYLAIPGFMSSLMSALPEALAAAAIVGGVLAWESRRPVLAAVAFGAALLIRETGIVLLLAVLLLPSGQGIPWRRSMTVLAAALAPVCAWRLFVASRLFDEFGWPALLTNPGDLGVPFAGVAQLWAAGVNGTQPSSEIGGALVFPSILLGAFLLAVSLWWVRRGALETAAVVYALVAVSLNYEKIWSHLPSGERGTFELFVCLLLLLLSSGGRPVWMRRMLTALFVALVGYTFLIAPDASTSRAALLLVR